MFWNKKGKKQAEKETEKKTTKRQEMKQEHESTPQAKKPRIQTAEGWRRLHIKK